jgi:outer membrane protein assembly factor BamD (BamD/ComL family)
VIVMDGEGSERRRLEGYLPKDDFQAWLELGLGRVAFMKKNWAAAEKHYANVIEQFPASKFAPEAAYYRGVSRYSASHESSELANTAAVLAEKYPGTEWQLRSIPWARE